jgi:oligoribonuclease
MNKQPMIWVDAETTGLSFTNDYVLEIGAFACDDDFVVLEKFHQVAHLDHMALERLASNDTVLEMHAKSGLIVDSVHAPFREWQAVDNFVLWAMQQVGVDVNDPDSRIRLWGSSVHFDLSMFRAAEVREHGNSRMIDTYIHYRVMDVSSISALFERYAPEVYENRPEDRKLHRVFDDLEDSIAKYQYYMARLNYLDIPG